MEIEGKIHNSDLNTWFDLSKISTNSFQELTQTMGDTHSTRNCFKFFEGSWHEYSFHDFKSKVFKIARFFVKKDISNQNVAILSESRPELVEIMYAGFCSNVCTTPIDVKLTPKEIAYILNDTMPKIIFVTRAQLHSLQKAQGLLNFEPLVIAINSIENFYSLSDLPENAEVELPSEDINKTGMIIYTSGSTGNMKGVETKGSQLLFQIYALNRIGFNLSEERSLSMLPMNHLFEVSGLISSLASGTSIFVVHSLEKEDIGMCLRYQSPTQLFTVPLFAKNIMNGIKLNVKDSPLPKRIVFGILMLTAKLVPIRSFRRKLFSPVHAKFGGSLKRMIAGGAAADLSIINFFKLLGINIYEGYGLTETAPVIGVNRVGKWRPGSVGPLIPGVKVKIDEASGEILTKGPHIIYGYYKNPEATAEVFTQDGWFKTGDIGRLDKDGCLYVTGRSKNVIILESGKNVHPEEVEKVFDDIDFIQEISIFGDKAKGSNNSQNVVLVAYLDETFFKSHGKDEAQRILSEEVMKRSDRIAAYKMPTKIVVAEKELPKTTTMKVKHFIVSQMYQNNQL